MIGKIPLTSTDFKAKMAELWPDGITYDPKTAHIMADRIICELLEDLGYGDGVAIFREGDKWYE